MNKYLKSTLCAATLIISLPTISSCSQTTNSMFGDDRSQLLLVSEESLNAEAKEAYDEVISKARANGTLNADRKFSVRVDMISKRLIEYAPQLRADCRNWNWEVNTIKDPTVNAWCMPGGKICVYTGLNDALQLTDDELASIVGHEISHALKEHSREKRSQASLQSGLTSIAKILGVKKALTDTANLAYNTAFAMPFSRDQESEADRYGLELMYKAGFDPNASVTVMEKLSRLEKEESAKAGGRQNAADELLSNITSTHPSSEKRFTDLKKLIEEYHLSQKNIDTKE